jgi:hypothetical protein
MRWAFLGLLGSGGYDTAPCLPSQQSVSAVNPYKDEIPGAAQRLQHRHGHCRAHRMDAVATCREPVGALGRRAAASGLENPIAGLGPGAERGIVRASMPHIWPTRQCRGEVLILAKGGRRRPASVITRNKDLSRKGTR